MTPEDLDKLFARLDGMVVPLDQDPTVLGPSYLQGKISQVRAHLNDLGVELQQLTRHRRVVQRQLQVKQTEYHAEFDRILATNPVVKQLPSAADRKAYINTELKELVKGVTDLELADSDLEYVEKALKFRHAELQDTMSAIRLQRSLIESEVRTQSYVGSTDLGDGQPSGMPKEDQDDITLESILAALDNPPPVEDITLDGISLGISAEVGIGSERGPDGHPAGCALAATGSSSGCPSCSGHCPDQAELTDEMRQQGTAAKETMPEASAKPFGTEVPENDIEAFLNTSNLF